MPRFFILLSMMFACTQLTGCNTIAGIGQDLQSGGAHVERAARGF